MKYVLCTPHVPFFLLKIVYKSYFLGINLEVLDMES